MGGTGLNGLLMSTPCGFRAAERHWAPRPRAAQAMITFKMRDLLQDRPGRGSATRIASLLKVRQMGLRAIGDAIISINELSLVNIGKENQSEAGLNQY